MELESVPTTLEDAVRRTEIQLAGPHGDMMLVAAGTYALLDGDFVPNDPAAVRQVCATDLADLARKARLRLQDPDA